MKRAIDILNSEIKNYSHIAEFYDQHPINGAVTAYTADQARQTVVSLRKALAVLEAPPSEECPDFKFGKRCRWFRDDMCLNTPCCEYERE